MSLAPHPTRALVRAIDDRFDPDAPLSVGSTDDVDFQALHQLSWRQYQSFLTIIFSSPERALRTYFASVHTYPDRDYHKTRAAAEYVAERAGVELDPRTHHAVLASAYHLFFIGDLVAADAAIDAIIAGRNFFVNPAQYWFELLIDTVELKQRLQAPGLVDTERLALELMLASRLQTFHWDIFRDDVMPGYKVPDVDGIHRFVDREYVPLFEKILTAFLTGRFTSIPFDWGRFFEYHREYQEQFGETNYPALRKNVADYYAQRLGNAEADSSVVERFVAKRFFYHALGLLPDAVLADLEQQADPHPYTQITGAFWQGRMREYVVLQAILAQNPNPRKFFDEARHKQGTSPIDWLAKPQLVLVGERTKHKDTSNSGNSPQPPLSLRGGSRGSYKFDTVHKLQVLTEDEFAAQKISHTFFKLHWDWQGDKLYIREAHGSGWSGLVEAHLWSKVPVHLSHPVERAVVLSEVNPRVASGVDGGLKWSRYVSYLSGEEDVISRLWSLKRLLNPGLVRRPERLVLVGTRQSSDDDAQVDAVRLLTPEEAKTIPYLSSKLTYAWDGSRSYLASVEGSYGVDLALEIFRYQKRSGEAVQHPVERAILAGRWGTVYESADPEKRLTWPGLLDYFKTIAVHEHPVNRLWLLQHQAQEILPKKPVGDFVLLGKKGGKHNDSGVSGLKLLMAREYDGEPGDRFELVFGQHGNKIFVRSASYTGAMEIALTLLYAGNPGLKPLDDVEQAFLASLWGFRLTSRDPEKTITWQKFATYLGQHDDGVAVAHLWDLLRMANPTLAARPEDLVLTALVRPSKAGKPVYGLSLKTPDQLTEVEQKNDHANVFFKWNGNRYQIASRRGASSKDVVALLAPKVATGAANSVVRSATT